MWNFASLDQSEALRLWLSKPNINISGLLDFLKIVLKNAKIDVKILEITFLNPFVRSRSSQSLHQYTLGSPSPTYDHCQLQILPDCCFLKIRILKSDLHCLYLRKLGTFFYWGHFIHLYKLESPSNDNKNQMLTLLAYWLTVWD